MKQVNHRNANLRSIIIMAVALTVGAGVSGFGGSANAADYYVDTNGSDTTGDGSQGDPWKTIEYAVEQQAVSGDMVYVNDGTYTEGQLNVPEGVDITSVSQNAGLVIVQPNWSTENHKIPLLKLSSTQGINNPTGNSITYLTLDGDGTSGVNRVTGAIGIFERDNVEIAHCIVRDFWYNTINTVDRIIYTTVAADPTKMWWDIWPKDAGLDGDDTNLDTNWPVTAVNHIENFQFHHNTVTNCGNAVSQRDGFVLALWCTKDSGIYNNIIDARGKPGTECIGGNSPTADLSGCLWNVDIYNNTGNRSQVFRLSGPKEAVKVQKAVTVHA